MAQAERAAQFLALHKQPGMLVVPNPWDAGTAKLLAAMGFKALATTSAGLAFSLGRPDAEAAVTRTEILDNARAIVEATDLPVSADLEGGFGDGRRIAPKPFAWRSRPGLPAARSRMQPRGGTSRCTSSAPLSIGCGRRRRRHMAPRPSC